MPILCPRLRSEILAHARVHGPSATGRHFGLTKSAVCGYIWRDRNPRAAPKGNRYQNPNGSPTELARQIVESYKAGVSGYALRRAAGCHQEQIENVLRRAGVKLRTMSQAKRAAQKLKRKIHL